MNEMTKTPVPAKASSRPTLPALGSMGWLRDEFDRLFDDFGRPGRSLFGWTPRFEVPVPAMELADSGKEYQLTAELPGLTEKDVVVELADGIVTISGEKKDESERKEDGRLVSERRYGSFKRQIGLPTDADEDGIKAKFKDGVLTLTIAKDEKATARTRRIAIEG